MPAWVPTVMSIGWALTVLALGFVIRVLVKLAKHDEMAKMHEELLKLIPEMKEDIVKMQTDTKVFWQIIGPHMSNVIHSPEHILRDHLIRKLDEGTLRYNEALQLNSELVHSFEDETDRTKKLAFAFKLAQVRLFLSHEDLKKVNRGDEGGPNCVNHTLYTS